jgi:hypothetical protein
LTIQARNLELQVVFAGLQLALGNAEVLFPPGFAVGVGEEWLEVVKVGLVVVEGETALHGPAETGMSGVQSSDFDDEVFVFGFEEELEVDNIGVVEDGLCAKVAFDEDPLDLVEGVHFPVEAAGALVLFASVGFGREADVHEGAADKAGLAGG